MHLDCCLVIVGISWIKIQKPGAWHLMEEWANEVAIKTTQEVKHEG